MFVVLFDAEDTKTPADLEQRERFCPHLEDCFELGLAEHRREGPARQRGTDATEAQQRRALSVAPLVDLSRLRNGPHLLPDAARLEDAADLVVEVHRPREHVRAGPLLEDDDRPPTLGELNAEHETDRAGTDDGDVGVDGGSGSVLRGHTWRSGWCPQALMAS